MPKDQACPTYQKKKKNQACHKCIPGHEPQGQWSSQD